jgi:nicotinamide-nucleotide amidase
LVCFTVTDRHGADISLSTRLPGGRADIRERATTVALHLLRRLLLAPDPAGLPDSAESTADRVPR